MNLVKNLEGKSAFLPPFFSLLCEEIKHIKGIIYPEIKIIIIFILMSPYDILPHFEERLICMFFFFSMQLQRTRTKAQKLHKRPRVFNEY